MGWWWRERCYWRFPTIKTSRSVQLLPPRWRLLLSSSIFWLSFFTANINSKLWKYLVRIYREIIIYIWKHLHCIEHLILITLEQFLTLQVKICGWRLKKDNKKYVWFTKKEQRERKKNCNRCRLKYSKYHSMTVQFRVCHFLKYMSFCEIHFIIHYLVCLFKPLQKLKHPSDL